MPGKRADLYTARDPVDVAADGRPVCDVIVYNDTAPACEQRMDNQKLLVMTEMIHRELKLQDPSYDPHGGFGKDKALQAELKAKEKEIWSQPFVPKPVKSSMPPQKLEESKQLHYRVNTGFVDLPLAATTATAFAYKPPPDMSKEYNRHAPRGAARPEPRPPAPLTPACAPSPPAGRRRTLCRTPTRPSFCTSTGTRRGTEARRAHQRCPVLCAEADGVAQHAGAWGRRRWGSEAGLLANQRRRLTGLTAVPADIGVNIRRRPADPAAGSAGTHGRPRAPQGSLAHTYILDIHMNAVHIPDADAFTVNGVQVRLLTSK